MPCDWSQYPKNWKLIRIEILAREGNRCECMGECGEHAGPEPRRCEELHGQPARWARGTVILTVAHLNQNPKDNRRSNLKAMCQRCHLRMDLPHHVHKAVVTRDRKKGQLRLGAEVEAVWKREVQASWKGWV